MHTQVLEITSQDEAMRMVADCTAGKAVNALICLVYFPERHLGTPLAEVQATIERNQLLNEMLTELGY